MGTHLQPLCRLMFRWTQKPFRTMGFFNDIVAVMFAVTTLFHLAGNNTVNRLLEQNNTNHLWSIGLLVAVAMEIYGFRYQQRIFAEVATGTLSLLWLYMWWVFAIEGRAIEALPYLFLPLMTSIYMRLKIHLDDRWYMR
jgi:hypothetical protein